MRNNVGLLLSKRAELSPQLEGFVDADTDRRFTYAEWNRRCNRTAHALRSLGVAKGDRVALLLMNGVEYMECFFALAKLGAVTVPLNWRLTPDELQFILKDSGARALIYGSEFAANAAELRGRGADATDVREWIHVGDAESRADWALDYGALQADASEQEPPIGGDEDDDLYIMYTSGTTGLPKGAVHTHNTALWALLTIASTADVRYRDRYLVALPLFHVGALTPLTGGVLGGLTNVVMRTFDPLRTWELIECEQITTMLAVPAMLTFMLHVPGRERYDCSSLRWCMSGAAPVPITLIRAFAEIGIEIHQVYGLTETCGPACLISPEEAIARAGSTGKAFFHTDVRVVDEAGRDVEPGAAGEVLVRGKHIMTGYWNRPKETAEAIQDGWLRSGDIATIDKDGFIYIQDRLKDMIISGGENVYPAEVENAILSHEKVVEVAVIGQKSARWGEAAAAVVVRADETLTDEEIFRHCEGKLARFKLPKRCYFVDQIPRNPTGKILKRVLRERFPEEAPE
ncbi:MAG: long-chain-fatty-acid--CoA ligase [Myxococcota bacterium]